MGDKPRIRKDDWVRDSKKQELVRFCSTCLSISGVSSVAGRKAFLKDGVYHLVRTSMGDLEADAYCGEEYSA